MAYIILILFLFFNLFLRKTTNMSKILTCISTIVFVLFISFSVNIGPDYNNYELLYEYTKYIPIRQIHGEIGFNFLMKIFSNKNIEYQIFRQIYLTTILLIMTIKIAKKSKNYELSLFILLTGYIVYLVSGIRQTFIIMTIILLIDDIQQEKHLKFISIMLMTSFFHISGLYVTIVYLLFLIINKMLGHKRNFKIKIKENYYIIIIMSIVIRVISFGIIRILNLNFGLYLNTSDLELFSFGLLSRIVTSILYIYFIDKDKIEKNIILNIYMFTNILYIIIPYGLAAGRLFNNFKVLEVFLINELLLNKSKEENFFLLGILVSISIAVFLYQIYGQGSYLPYENTILKYFLGG